ncbi:MAG: TIGR02117 family protein [Bacteroidota bacterium]
MPVVLGYLLKFVLGVIAIIGLYILAAYVLPLFPTKAKPTKGPISYKTFLVGNGVHLDLAIPRQLLPNDLIEQVAITSNAQYFAFGWGDRGFYLDAPTWAELKFKTAVKAMLLKSPTVMHVVEHDVIGENWRTVSLSEEQLTDIITYLQGGFQTDERNCLIEIEGESYSDRDKFYEATGDYHALLTCNTWINKGLKQAGLRTAVWSAREQGVLRYFPAIAE